MTHKTPPEHYKGKSAAAHLKDARRRGAIATSEVHGAELPGHISAGADSAKEVAVIYLIIWAIGTPLGLQNSLLLTLFISFGLAIFLWKMGRSALLGWGRLERLHNLIEEERWEIEHHRQQEKEELKEMYAAKGFTGKLLDDVVDVLIADDNRLLRVMLEEELGLSLEVYEHPLKQALGAALGAFVAAGLACLFAYFWPLLGIPLTTIFIVAVASNTTAKLEKRGQISSIVWNLSLSLLSGATAYFLTELISP
ncbi:MAG: hypothetical protein KR126chlam1_00276 [Chlamydiae bacterium]|nr:hypothetical protein [Chlamydiota bacterium]